MSGGDLLRQLRRSQLALQTAFDDALRDLDLTAAQFTLLDALATFPGASNAELARSCSVTPQSMHGVMQLMEQRGLLVREPHRVHGRVIRGYLSNAGEVKLAVARSRIADLESRFFAGFTGEERAQFSRLLGMISGGARH